MDKKTRTATPCADREKDMPVAVRMYDVGFGDCFLLKLDTKKGLRKVLFDCGTIKKNSLEMSQVVRMIADDTREDDGVPRIDVIVATHRHLDHVSGFAQKQWADFEVKEVWMPWTEDPSDPEAKVIRDAQARLALCLKKETEAKLKAQGLKEEDVTRLELANDLAANALSSDAALQLLHHGFSSQPVRRFLPDKKSEKNWFTTEALPELTVRVLGPSFDPDAIRDMDPPAGQSYLKLFDPENQADASSLSPFAAEWRLLPGELKDEFTFLAQSLDVDDRKTIRQVGQGFESSVGATLDQAVNGTSLVLLLQFRQASLLFAGDAQWGTWSQILKNEDVKSLLKNISFYKVGHHGSHNATPVDFVEKVMPKGIQAMISVTTYARYPRIPKKELLEAMKNKSVTVIRSDESSQDPAHRGSAMGVREITIEA